MEKIKIAIFDDNKNVRDSIELLLNTDPQFEVVGIYRDAEDCVKKVLQSCPDIVLMDIEMPGKSGIEAVKEIKENVPHIQIIIQTVFEDEERIFESICAGASGYILKSTINQTLLNSIKELRQGGAPLTPLVARKMMYSIYQSSDKYTQQASVEYNLTPKEKEVLSYIVNGQSYKMIGFELNISYETVRSHIKKIYEKLQVASLTELVAKAINEKIV
ncbi:response regulator transcription factor [Flavobacterium sp. MC2016-06]|jgi:DNA-binding NarL/FixJ family response regulator|uniref:response regulator transcription factor n=1 Tax=Flavobacterium sp. MC2016-06 TaxID=2676308 RepID=UPI0012BACA5A|nr:response regulator transcription factor [Flavobacterium sp. MC2016-06]MBU3857768.1 response regulator transcription factor [Flavobacterium sp. MC2016-06]